MKELGQLFITIVVVAAWCAMWFVVVTTEIEFPALLHAAFVAVMLFNGYEIVQTTKVKNQAKLKAKQEAAGCPYKVEK